MSPPQAYMDDTVPIGRGERAQKVVRDLMQR